MIIPLEDRILSLFNSGVYITNKELVDIGESIGISLPLKSREIVFGKIINFAKEEKKERELISILEEKIELRIAEYSGLKSNYPLSENLLDVALHRANEVKLSLKKEFND